MKKITSTVTLLLMMLLVYLRGQLGWRIFNYGENTSSVVQNGLPIFMLGAGAVWAVK